MIDERERRFPGGAAITLAQLEGGMHPALAELRSREPVSWLPALDGWLVTDRATALDVMRDAETFTVDDPRFSTARVVGPSMLSRDGTEHDRHREPFADAFRRQAIHDSLAPWVRDESRRLVTELAPAGRGELRQALAAPLAVGAITECLGLVDADPDRVLDWYRGIVAAVVDVSNGLDVTSAGRNAVEELLARVEATIEESAGSMLSAAAATGTLDTPEIFSNTAVIMFGAIETAESMTANALLHLLSHPDQLDDVRHDRSLVVDAVEESLRLEPAATLVDRYATRDVTIGGAEISAGHRVAVSLAGANRDPRVFDQPHHFDLHRANARQHLSFVHGPHSCLGIHLARLETAQAVEAVLDLLPGVTLDAAASTPPRGLLFRKPSSVAVRWRASATASPDRQDSAGQERQVP